MLKKSNKASPPQIHFSSPECFEFALVISGGVLTHQKAATTFTVSGSVLFHESRDDGDGVGTGEMFASSCESVCVGAADALETGDVLVYSAAFHSPLWMSGGKNSLHLQDREVLDMLQISMINFAS